MKLTMLGTGNAMVTKIYNTCFLLEEEGKYLLVDGGGGNQILPKLSAAGVKTTTDIHDIIVTHTHMDHILGIMWVIRSVCQKMASDGACGDLKVYAHDECIETLYQMTQMLMIPKQTKFIGDKIHFISVESGQTVQIMGHAVTFFDTGSTKTKQYGFTMEYEPGKKCTCLGDEPYRECEYAYAKDSTWLMHEAFCLQEQADIFKPYEKHHSTAYDAGTLASKLQVENLLLYHTEDKTIESRKEAYKAEAQKSYSGNVIVPDDMETIWL